MNNTTRAVDDVVARVHEETLQEFVPVIVCLSILSFLGSVGNGFAIGFYGFHTRRTPTVLLITVLAVVDLSVCVILIHAIIEIAVNVYYTNRVTCKIFHFMIHWAIAASALILGVISIDRHRRICQPLKRQIGVRLAKKIAIVTVFIAFLLSIRDFINFDIIEFPLESEVNGTVSFGHYCTTTDDPRLKISVTIFLNLDALLFVIIMVTLIVTYGRILWTICKRGEQSPNQPASSKEQNKTDDIIETDDGNVSNDETAEKDDETENKGNSKGDAHSKSKPRFKTNLKKSERSITLLMLIVSVGFFICFVPYFIIKLGLRNVKRASDLELSAGTQFGIRLVYVNSFLNPVIFCVFNPQFRRYIAGIVAKCVRSKKYETESSSQVQMSTSKSQMSFD